VTNCIFVDQKVPMYLILLLSIFVDGLHLQKSLKLCRSNWIGMKFGRIVLQVNTYRLTESDC